MVKEEYEEYYVYLERLRQSGVCNMFAAPRYLMEDFGISKDEAHEIFQNWSSNYQEIASKYYNK